MEIDTWLASARHPQDPHRATSPPLWQTATFVQGSCAEADEYDYSRSGNPTRTHLEAQLQRLEGGGESLAYSSGMAALSAVLALVRPGERVLCGSDLYGGTWRLLSRVVEPAGVRVDFVDTCDTRAVERELERPTRLLLVESPSNPLLEVSDLPALAAAAHAAGAWTAVDGTLLSPYLQRPLELGADLVVQSATKHLCGHGDVTAGVVTCALPELAEELRFRRNAEGTALAPFEAWLLLRGLRTLGVRMERQQAGAQRLAEELARHPDVRAVHYPGLDTHPHRERLLATARGAGCVLSFETGSVARSRALVDATEVFATAVSFGCVASTISLPCRMSHAAIPADVRRERALPEDLVRLSVGLEDPRDLLEDLRGALARAGEIRESASCPRPEEGVSLDPC